MANEVHFVGGAFLGERGVHQQTLFWRKKKQHCIKSIAASGPSIDLGQEHSTKSAQRIGLVISLHSESYVAAFSKQNTSKPMACYIRVTPCDIKSNFRATSCGNKNNFILYKQGELCVDSLLLFKTDYPNINSCCISQLFINSAHKQTLFCYIQRFGPDQCIGIPIFQVGYAVDFHFTSHCQVHSKITQVS